MKSQTPLFRSLVTIFWLTFLSNYHTLKTTATPHLPIKSEKKNQIPITIPKNNYFQISQIAANQLPSIKAERSAIFLFPHSPLIAEKLNTKNNYLLNPTFNPPNATQKLPSVRITVP